MDSSSALVNPTSASYQLVHHLESASSGTRCGCIINDTSMSTTDGLSLDYELLVTGSTDGVVIIWRLHDDGIVDIVSEFVGHDGTIMDLISCKLVVPATDSNAAPSSGTDCTVLEASLTFYTCGRDRMIHRFNVSGRKILTFVGHEDVVCSIHESHDGSHLVSGSWDGTAIIWNALTGAIEHRLGGNSYKYSVYCNSLFDGTVVTGMTNGDLCFWRSGQLDKVLRAHNGVLRAISVHNNTILTSANDCSVRMYSDRMEPIFTIPIAHDNFIYDVRHSKNFPIFFTSSEDKSVGVWDVKSGKLLQLLTLESSVWKVIETRRHGIVVIPLNGNISFWQLIPGSTPICNILRDVDFNTTGNIDPPKQSFAEVSFEMTTFHNANGSKAMEYLCSFNRSKTSDTAIAEKELASINAIFNTRTTIYGDLSFVFKLIQWPTMEKVPVFDFLKLLLLDPSCSSLFKGRNSGFQIYSCVCTTLNEASGSPQLVAVSLQLLANMFVLTLPRTILLTHFDTTVGAIKNGGALCTRMVQQAHSACIKNLIIASSDRIIERSERILDCIQSALSVLRRAKDPEPWIGAVMLRHCRSLETLMYFDSKVAPLLHKTGVLQLILDVGAEVLPNNERCIIDETVHQLRQRIN